jgi:hypothetical protein
VERDASDDFFAIKSPVHRISTAAEVANTMKYHQETNSTIFRTAVKDGDNGGSNNTNAHNNDTSNIFTKDPTTDFFESSSSRHEDFCITTEPTTAVNEALEQALFSVDDSPVNLSTVHHTSPLGLANTSPLVTVSPIEALNTTSKAGNSNTVFSLKNDNYTVSHQGHHHPQVQIQPHYQAINSVIRINPANISGTQLYTTKSLQATGGSGAPSVIVQEQPVIKLTEGLGGQVISVKEVDTNHVSQVLSLSQNFSTGMFFLDYKHLDCIQCNDTQYAYFKVNVRK